MRILNVNSSLGLKAGGGTAERTFQMSRYWARKGEECTILTLDIELDEQRTKAIAPAKVVVLQCLWKRFYVPFGGLVRIQELVEHSDVIHLMNHWSVLNALVYFAAQRAHKPYVVCPAGALPVFGRSAFLKWLYNIVIGRAIIKNASAWVAVTEGEFPGFESYGIDSSRITVIPNGVCEEDFPATDRRTFLERFGLPDVPYILFMGRLNPIKGPDLLLQAFIRARQHFPAYHLFFAGPDGGLLSELQKLVKEAGVERYVHFLGYVAGEDKSAAYRFTKLLVIPSRLEAMSIVALEAGICGTAVLLTDQCGFSEIRKIDTRLEVAASIEGLENGLIQLLRVPSELEEIAVKWKNFVSQHYTWSNIISLYQQMYGNVLSGYRED